MQRNVNYAEVLNSAIASVEIEGYKLDEEQKAFCLEFVSGNMKKEDFINIMLERCRA